MLGLRDKVPYHQLLGFHTGVSLKKIDQIFASAKMRSDVVQVFATPPKTCDFLTEAKAETVYQAASRHGLKVIWHGPYTCNLVNMEHRTFKWSRQYIAELFKVAQQFTDKVMLVMHTGKPVKDAPQFGHKSLGQMLFSLSCNFTAPAYKVDMDKCVLCIETDCNPYYDPRQNPCGLNMLIHAVHVIGRPWVRVCFDTEHTYAAGVEVTDKWRFKKWGSRDGFPWPAIGVVHLNGIPANVELGSGKDRHGKQTLEDSKGGSEWILEIAKNCKIHKIPMILERSDSEVIDKDIIFIKDRWSKL